MFATGAVKCWGDDKSGQIGNASLILPAPVMIDGASQAQAPLSAVTEFYHPSLDHYFITASTAEATAIGGGSAGPGWMRTGNTFKSGGVIDACRFYGSITPGPNSHFYTASTEECDALKQVQAATLPTERRWNFESLNFATTPATNGLCPNGTVQVYRAYNNGFANGVDSNHRITANLTAHQAVINRGWVNEGVVMCAPL